MFNILRSIVVIGVLFTLSACGEADTLPDGFSVLHSKGAYHFAYMDTKKLTIKNKVKLRDAGRIVCLQAQQEDYCEVYIWDDKKMVSKSIPVENRIAVVAIYSSKQGKIRLKITR